MMEMKLTVVCVLLDSGIVSSFGGTSSHGIRLLLRHRYADEQRGGAAVDRSLGRDLGLGNRRLGLGLDLDLGQRLGNR